MTSDHEGLLSGHNLFRAPAVVKVMNRRNRLTWVTVLTVASLMLGGGALNALAAEHAGGGNGDHGGNGHGKSEQPPQQPTVAVAQANPDDGEKNNHNTNTNTTTNSNTNADTNTNTDTDTAVDQHPSGNNDVQRQGDDNEDLVTPPVRVTGEDRPGLGCGDDNHTHTGAPGNPGKTCKSQVTGADAQSVTTDDDSAAGAAAAVDGSDGN